VFSAVLVKFVLLKEDTINEAYFAYEEDKEEN
jgi:hypothetical protein